MNCKTIIEGRTELFVPVPPEGSSFPPSAAPVFYNPAMELNRDINVAATAAFVKRLLAKKALKIEDIRYLDAFSASGIRGLRIAKEVGIHATLNDWSLEAFELIKKNIEHAGLSEKAEASRRNANVLLHESKFNLVDIDPFGTPAPFLDAAAVSALNLLSVTATDTAPLCGAHLNSGIRKYAAVPLNREFHREMGLRILLGACAREVAKHEKAIIPLFSHVTRHYVRTYLEIRKGAKQADRTLKYMGFLSYCPHCGERETVQGLAVHIKPECPFCGGLREIAGPMWLGPLREKAFCNELLEEMEEKSLNTKEQAAKIISFCRDELDIPLFFDQHVICKQLGVSASGIDLVIDSLKIKGFKASRTHFSGTAFKTDASIAEIKKIIRTLG
ncbi:MAG: tRNA (guanine(10)-N(2))-dimethyltransferase [Methanosarcinaceae archaeon]|nr:tRNA (guanine(10)-N(2))-dimethyltransferase [Methanosarcinaceae archaeon]MDD4331208.1 tRNA (guanine(10)-N(2))-dimethyltransferase [Methanosarcinaceae archaeon]MDD4749583.1 tRNA (guanine(10)-N(2))-dimethyltransferase [Methanosarcinaceae archaeon]